MSEAQSGRIRARRAGELPGFSESRHSHAVAAVVELALKSSGRRALRHEHDQPYALVLLADSWDSGLAHSIDRRLAADERISPLHLMQSVPNGVLGRLGQIHGNSGPIFTVSLGDVHDEGEVERLLTRVLHNGRPSTALIIDAPMSYETAESRCLWQWAHWAEVQP